MLLVLTVRKDKLRNVCVESSEAKRIAQKAPSSWGVIMDIWVTTGFYFVLH